MSLRVALRYPDEGGMYGIKRYSVELAHGLRALGVDVRQQRSWASELKLGPLRVGGSMSRRLAPYVPAPRADVVHATTYHVAPRVGRLDLVTIHDVMPSVRPDLYGLDEAARAREDARVRVALRARHVSADSAHTKANLVSRFEADPGRITVVPLGIREDAFFPEPLASGDPLRALLDPAKTNVLCVMNAELRKRVDLLLDAAATRPDLRVIHVGNPEAPAGQEAITRHLARASETLRREGRYVHLPRATDAQLRGLLSSVDFVVHPSVDEGFGLPPLEALACGARVLASDIPPHRETLGDSVRWFALDVESLGRALDARHAPWPDAEARVAQARRFTWARCARETLALYERLAAER